MDINPVLPVRLSTPVTTHFTHSQISSYDSKEFGSNRQALFKDFQYVHIAPVDELLGKCFPPVSADHLHAVTDYLTNNQLVRDSRRPSSSTWLSRGAARMRCPSMFARTQDFIFGQGIPTIVNDVLTAHHAVKPAHLSQAGIVHIITDGQHKLSSAFPVSFRPDAAFLIRKNQMTDSEKKLDSSKDYMVTPTLFEFKKDDNEKNRLDNAQKVVWGMHYIMRNDPRRMFVYGCTIENTNARIWYHDRATVYASEIFGINKDWRQLTHFFLAISTASRVQLGFDESVRLVGFHNVGVARKHIFEYDVYDSSNGIASKPRTFRTVRHIFDRGADAVVGRAPRIWEVVEVTKGEEPAPNAPHHVLKDLWSDSDRHQEHEVMQSIRNRLKSKDSEDPRLRHFLTVLCAGFVPDFIGNSPTGSYTRGSDLTPTDSMKLVKPPPTPVDNSQSAYLSSQTTVPDNAEEAQPLLDEKVMHLSKIPRRHYRIVFEELGEVARHSSKLSRFYFSLLGSLCGSVLSLHDAS